MLDHHQGAIEEIPPLDDQAHEKDMLTTFVHVSKHNLSDHMPKNASGPPSSGHALSKDGPASSIDAPVQPIFTTIIEAIPDEKEVLAPQSSSSSETVLDEDKAALSQGAAVAPADKDETTKSNSHADTDIPADGTVDPS